MISEKSTRVGPQLGCRGTESGCVATTSCWEQGKKKKKMAAPPVGENTVFISQPLLILSLVSVLGHISDNYKGMHFFIKSPPLTCRSLLC